MDREREASIEIEGDKEEGRKTIVNIWEYLKIRILMLYGRIWNIPYTAKITNQEVLED